MRQSVVAAAVALTTVLAAANATAQPAQQVDPNRCTALMMLPPSEAGYEDVVIDVDKGALVRGQMTYPDGTKVRVIVLKNNPFKYDYNVNVTTEPLNRANVQSLFGLIPGFQVPGLISSAAEQDDSALKMLAQYDVLDGRIQALDAASKAVEDLAKKVSEIIKAHTEFMLVFNNDMSNMSQLCQSAANTYTALLGLPAAKDFDTPVKNLSDRSASAFQQLEQPFGAVNTAAQARLNDNAVSDGDKNQLRTQLAGLRTRLDTAKTRATNAAAAGKQATDTLTAKQDGITALKGRIEGVFQRNTSFVEIAARITATEAIVITGSGFKTNPLTGETTKIRETTVTVGNADVHISAGIGFSTVDDVSITRQQGLDSKGALIAKFGYENNSSFKPSAIAMLNVPILEREAKAVGKLTVGPAVGLVVTNRSTGTEIEYVVGAGVGLKSDLVFLNFGLHAARVAQLAGGFSVGDKIPDGLNDPLPVERDWKAGFMFSVTFKLR